jgi:dipeptidyl aminopeptidase/acylaminoacyl peptidase
MTSAPYGSWTSPISAAELAAGGHPVGGARFVGHEIWWTELRAAEGGRQSVRRHGADGAVTDVLPAPWNARSRVHEYGGHPWLGLADGSLVFVEFTDQRLYLLRAGATEPEPLTPAAPARYADPLLCPDRDEVWCVRETHDDSGVITRDLCAVPLDGRAAGDPAALRSVVGGSDFLAAARLSPDGSRLAFIAWNHPQMPWDGTELRVADVRPDGTCEHPRTLIGTPTESVMQPEWADDNSLFAVSDRSGWWNLYRVALDGTCDPVHAEAAEYAGAMWVLGMRWYAPRADGRLLAVRTFGSDSLVILDPDTGQASAVDLPGISAVSLSAVDGDRVLLTCAGPRTPGGIRTLDLRDGRLDDVRLSVSAVPEAGYLPVGELMTFPGPSGREVHTVVYRPTNPDFTGLPGELAPFVARAHGGPTDHVSTQLSLPAAYFTSRGIGVVEVNYGGSTGYGREYRERLRGQWGVVDVEDTVAAVRGLVEAGIADGRRLAVEGGSAGGFTVLAALTGTDVFACGVSYFGVADLNKLLEHTHDFESQYPFGLVGPLPEAAELYASRSPLHNVDGLSCPVLLLQGLLDPVVPPEQAELFRDALLRKGIPHAYLAFEGESHGFRRAENQIAAREAELSFYGQVLGFETPDVPVLQLWRPQP